MRDFCGKCNIYNLLIFVFYFRIFIIRWGKSFYIVVGWDDLRGGKNFKNGLCFCLLFDRGWFFFLERERIWDGEGNWDE